MDKVPGIIKPELQTIPIIADRMTFLYLEHCIVNREDGAVTATDQRGTVHVPAASLAVVMLGPGTNISHRAIELLGETGVSMLWVGEHGVKYYAYGQAQTHSASLLIRQAKLVSNSRSRVEVARKMYQMRFSGENVENMTMQQLRGREGARMRSVYRKSANEWGIEWNRRTYDPNDMSASDPVNAALSVGNACLYGLAHCVILALGCSPGLGFVHDGHERSFIYDIADLYKAEITIPLSFKIAATEPQNIGAAMRHATRDAMVSAHLLERMVRDVRRLLLTDDEQKRDMPEAEVVYLWDDKLGRVDNGISY